jgi:spermidine/putrescine-binding protein
MTLLAALASAQSSAALAQAPLHRSLQMAGYGGPTQQLFANHIFAPFSRATRIDVSWDTVPGGIVAGVQAQQETDNIQWDGAIELLGAEAALLAQLGYLAPLPADLTDPPQAGGTHIANAALFGFGASIIICNGKYVKRCPSNAAEFFDTRNFPGGRMMSSFQPTTALAVAMLAAGKPPQAVFPIDMRDAQRRLNALKPSIRTFYSSGDEAVRLLRMGEVPIAYFWNGIVARMLAETHDDTWHVSWQGGVRFGMYNVLFKGAPDRAEGLALLRWIRANPGAVAAEHAAEGVLPTAPGSAAAHADLVTEDDTWYLAHRTEVDDFWSEFINY